MDSKTGRESLDLAFHMSNLLETGLDRHTLSVLIALCDVKELTAQASSSPPSPFLP